MAKSRSFSIYLLKTEYDSYNALREDHSLVSSVQAHALPQGAKLFVLDNAPHSPWWKGYFQVQMQLEQVGKGALVFLPVENRMFVLSFGHVAHNLIDEAYEYDFGLKVTLNCVDPMKLKSSDTLEPGTARRRRTQLAVETELTYFDFDRDSNVLKSITGKVKDEYKDLIRQATGASSLRVSSPVPASGLVELCSNFLELYSSSEYKRAFPDIQNISPVRDPAVVRALDGKLIEAVRQKNDAVHLSVPDIVNYTDSIQVEFRGQGSSLQHSDVSIESYYDYVESNDRELQSLNVADLKNHQMLLVNEDRVTRESYSLYKSIIFDTRLPGRPAAYYFNEGNWYEVDRNYLRRITRQLEEYWDDLSLPPCSEHLEGDYNKQVGKTDDFVCLDKANISPRGQSQVEPCDLITLKGGQVNLIHVKISTDSSKLSHLFNQGANSIELLKSEPESVKKLIDEIKKRCERSDFQEYKSLIEDGAFRVTFAIITTKPKSAQSANLPLFSRISLLRNARTLSLLMSVPVNFGFVDDNSPTRDAKKKQRKSRAKPNKASR